MANGLKLSERRKFEIAAYDIGNLYHYSLELFCRKLRNKNLNWRNLTDEDIQKLVEECVNIVFEEYENNAISSDARNKYIANKILKTTINTTEILKSHINAGKFEPVYYESVVEHGKVDRVDLYEDPDEWESVCENYWIINQGQRNLKSVLHFSAHRCSFLFI